MPEEPEDLEAQEPPPVPTPRTAKIVGGVVGGLVGLGIGWVLSDAVGVMNLAMWCGLCMGLCIPAGVLLARWATLREEPPEL